MHIYYSIIDPYPAYRADLAELFGVELRKLGLQTEWFMAAVGDQVGNSDAYAGQVVHIPGKAPSKHRIVAKVWYVAADLRHLGSLLFRSVDAIQCRDKYIASLAGLLVARIRGIPFFYWCSYPFPEHGRLAADARKGWRRQLSKLVADVRFFLLYRVICRLADHVFVQSSRMQADMHAYGVPLASMTPVPMGVSVRILDWSTIHRPPVVPLRVAYVGTLAAIRRLDILLDAMVLVMQKVPGAQLVIVGEGDYPHERQALAARAAGLGLVDRILFTGFLPMEKAWLLAASAAVCVSPLWPNPVLAAGSPTKLVEYLALGRPVVCNDHPEQSEIIAQSGAGLCVEWSATAFADAIVRLLTDPVAAEAMARRGPAWVAANRTYPIIAQPVWRKYQSLMTGAHA